MTFKLLFSIEAEDNLKRLESDPSLNKQLKAVQKSLGYLQTNPKHPGLNTHKYKTFTGANGEDLFEAYAENHTPGAYRIFWHYGPRNPGINEKIITIVAITPHP